MLFENPVIDSSFKTSVETDTNATTNQIKNAYSQYLSYLKINDFSTTSKFENNEIKTSFVLPNKKYHDPDDLDSTTSKIDQSPLNLYFDSVSSSRISLLYAKYDGEATSGVTGSSIITQEEYQDKTHEVKVSGDKKSIYIKIDPDNVGKKICDSFATGRGEDDKTPDKNKSNDEVYVIKDINGLISRMLYDIEIYYYYSNKDGVLKNKISDANMKILENSFHNMKMKIKGADTQDYDFANDF
jgi:hypothetical protein